MYIKVDGYNIEYKITGEGDDIAVILQGWGTKLSVYDSIAGLLSGKFKVITFDLPGFGGSEEPREAWDVERYSEFFCHFMQALSVKKAVLVGHSYGGRIIIKLADKNDLPFEIDRIVLIDSAGIMPKRSFKQRFNIRKYKILKHIYGAGLVEFLFPELVEDWRMRQGSADYRNASPIMRQCMVMAVNEDLTSLLSGINKETLLIWGDKDTATPLSDGKLMESKIKNSGLAVIEGAGHFSFLDKPAVFNSILKSYFGME